MTLGSTVHLNNINFTPQWQMKWRPSFNVCVDLI